MHLQSWFLLTESVEIYTYMLANVDIDNFRHTCIYDFDM